MNKVSIRFELQVNTRETNRDISNSKQQYLATYNYKDLLKGQLPLRDQ